MGRWGCGCHIGTGVGSATCCGSWSGRVCVVAVVCVCCCCCWLSLSMPREICAKGGIFDVEGVVQIGVGRGVLLDEHHAVVSV